MGYRPRPRHPFICLKIVTSFIIWYTLFRMMKYKLYLVDYYENLQVEQVEADTETDALLLLALAARLNEFEPIGVELAA